MVDVTARNADMGYVHLTGRNGRYDRLITVGAQGGLSSGRGRSSFGAYRG